MKKHPAGVEVDVVLSSDIIMTGAIRALRTMSDKRITLSATRRDVSGLRRGREGGRRELREMRARDIAVIDTFFFFFLGFFGFCGEGRGGVRGD